MKIEGKKQIVVGVKYNDGGEELISFESEDSASIFAARQLKVPNVTEVKVRNGDAHKPDTKKI